MQPVHIHTPRRDSQGRDICTVCSSVVINPIISEDDPRLQGAGLHRSGDAYSNSQELEPIPLPFILINLYYDHDAPVPQYVNVIGKMHNWPNTIWDVLYGEWYYQWSRKTT